MSDAVNAFLLVYATLFPIVNPLGLVPIFLSLTADRSPAARQHLAWRVARNGFFLLLGSLFVGSHVLEFFGITLPVVRLAGGSVVTFMGWKLLTEGAEQPERRESAGMSESTAGDDAFYPLTMPLTVGPGSMAVAITLGSQRPRLPGDLATIAVLATAAVAGLVAIALTVYVSFRFADRVEAALGKTGVNVLVRLSAFILLCIGIQIVWNGYSALVGIHGN